MKIGVYFCKCGTNISGKIDPEKVRALTLGSADDIHFAAADFLCSEDGKEFLEKDIREKGVDRIVVSACSPRDHESTFMRVLAKTGINPYLMQMVNAREQVAWVTEDWTKAIAKVSRYINAAVKRVMLHDPLDKREIDICPDVVVIGAGPAGLKAALSIAESGRKAVVIEKTPVIGGMPVRYEEIFPGMECGPCMLEPMMAEVLHGEYADNIELLTLSEVVGVKGSYGNFIVKIKKSPRHVDIGQCIGCGECAAVCPSSAKNEFDCGLSERKAVDFPFTGALPNAVFIDEKTCLKLNGRTCNACAEACPAGEGVFNFDEKEEIIERNAGAIIVAVGSSLYDARNISALGYGKFPDILTSLEFERMIASNGYASGEIRISGGRQPESIAIVHCVGSLDKDHKEYCSGICCQYAFKFNHVIAKKAPGTRIHHYYKELVVPGKEAFSLYQHARENPDTLFHRYDNISELEITEADGRKVIANSAAGDSNVTVDMVVLCPAVVPADESGKLGEILEAPRDRFGFFEELHGRMDSAESKIRGVYLAGACQSPMDIQKSMNQGMAAAGYVLSRLVIGRKLEITPLAARVDEARCSGCRVCVSVCPYKAISFDAEKEVSVVNDILCHGCGTCMSACPACAISGKHFTNEEIFSEIEGILS